MILKDVYKVVRNGVDITDYVVSFKRSVSICEGIETLELILDISIGIDYINIFDTIEIYEEGNKIKTFFVDDVGIRIPDKVIVISANDMKRIRDYFIDDNYIIDYPSSVQYWIQKFADDAGVNVNFISSGNGGLLSNNTSLGMTSFYEQLQTLLQIAGWYMRTDENANVVIGDLMVSRTPSGVIKNVIKFDRIKDDKPLRNRAVVWGSYNQSRNNWVYADVYKPTPWDIDSNDKRTVVVANSNIPNTYSAYGIANKVLKTFNSISDIITVDVPGISGLDVGDSAYLLLPYFRGLLLLTSYVKSVSKSGAIETLVFNEKCPRLFAYWGWDFDYYYVATDKGIFRKAMITQSGQNYTWYDYNLGLPDDRFTPEVKASNELLVTYIESGNAYYRDTILETPWIEIPYSGTVAGVANTGNNIYVGYNFSGNYEIMKVGYYGGKEIVITGSGSIIDIDALYSTIAYSVAYSGYKLPVNNSYLIYDYIVDPDSGIITSDTSEYYTPSNFDNNIYTEFQYSQEINEVFHTDINSNIKISKFIHADDKDYSIGVDYNNNLYLLVCDRNGACEEYSYNFDNAIDAVKNLSMNKENIIFVLPSSDRKYLYKYSIRLDDYSISHTSIYVCSDNEIISQIKSILNPYNDTLLIMYSILGDFNENTYRYSTLKIRYYKQTHTNIYNDEIFYKHEDGEDIWPVRYPLSFMAYGNSGIVLSHINRKSISLDNPPYEKTIYNLLMTIVLTNEVTTKYKTVEMSMFYSGDDSYFPGIIGVDKKNSIVYIMNLHRFGFKVYLESFSIIPGYLNVPYSSGALKSFRFIETDEYLYLIVYKENVPDNKGLLYIYNLSVGVYEPTSIKDSSIIGIKDGKFIISTENGFIVKDRYDNILYQYINQHPNEEVQYNNGYYVATIYGDIFKYVVGNGKEIICYPKGYINDSYGKEKTDIKIFDDSNNIPYTVFTTNGKYKLNVGLSSIYLYFPTMSPTYDYVMERNRIILINNGINMVFSPKEGQIVNTSGLDRDIFAISNNTSFITVAPICDIINNEYYYVTTSGINTPIDGHTTLSGSNVIEVTNYVLNDEDIYSKIIISNGRDKIYENYGGTDFDDTTENLIDDFDISVINHIAVDDDL